MSIALKMFSDKDVFSADDHRGISIVPLTFPPTADPGTIMTAILSFSQSNRIFEAVFVFIGIVVEVVLTYIDMTRCA